jgi:soluble lytic murein transglycosylase-like protein
VSAQAIDATGAVAGDPASAASRITAIEQMIAQVTTGFQPQPTSSGATSAPAFSDVLASAASAAAPAAGSTASAAASGYEPLIDEAAAEYGINPAILTGLVNQESGFNPDAVSSAGAEGLTQVMPENFAADGITDPFDPAQSIFGGAKQLGEDLDQFGGNVTDALAAYNAGSAAVQEYGGVPPYTQTENYVSDILGYAQQYEEQQTASSAVPTATVTDPVAGVSIE